MKRPDYERLTQIKILLKILNVTKYSVTFAQLNEYKKAASLEDAFRCDMLRFSENDRLYTMAEHQNFPEYLYSLPEVLKKNIHFLTSEELKNLQITSPGSHIFILPEINFTIFNINYDRLTNKEYGTPYFVAIKNKKYAPVQQHLLNMGFSEVDEPFALFPHVARYYFESTEMINWLKQKSCLEAHNWKIEKELFTVSKNNFTASKITWDLYSDFANSKNIFYDHYPIHLFYKNYLNIKLEINIREQNLYEV